MAVKGAKGSAEGAGCVVAWGRVLKSGTEV